MEEHQGQADGKRQTPDDRPQIFVFLILLFIAFLIGVIFFLPLILRAEPLEIKLATLAPEGSLWMNTLQAMKKEIENHSQGRLSLRFYAGGIAGDEKDVLRKIRIGQLHGGVFSGVGLGEVLPEVRVLELPFLFQNYAEVDYITEKLWERFDAAFRQKGFVLLGSAEAGFVYLFSHTPIRGQEDLQKVKIWTWAGDPLPREMFATYGVVPIPLALPDVLTALQTGLINAFYGPPLAAISFQWFTRVRYMLSLRFTDAIGAILLARSRWEKIPPDLQTLLLQTTRRYAQQIVELTRQENEKGIELLKQNGIEILDLPPGEVKKLEVASTQVQQKFVGTLYSQELLDTVRSLVKEYRGAKGEATQ
jgi:TRAP-type C4-dicarboxylate transport system substrate-binding protein